jgi:hypothetical protein
MDDRRSPVTALQIPAARRERYYLALSAEHNPTTLIESLLIRGIAREAAQIERDQDLLDLLHVEAERVFDSISQPLADQAPALSAQSSFLRRLSHDTSRRTAELARSVRLLSELKRRGIAEFADLDRPDHRFILEPQCLAYLANRFRNGTVACRSCGSRGEGSWLAARRVWECSQCGVQTCCRNGSVLERSSLPLTQWFHAVRCVLFRPSLTALELEKFIKINRRATAGRMLRKIRSAILADDASQKLAGLDEVFFGGT